MAPDLDPWPDDDGTADPSEGGEPAVSIRGLDSRTKRAVGATRCSSRSTCKSGRERSYS